MLVAYQEADYLLAHLCEQPSAESPVAVDLDWCCDCPGDCPGDYRRDVVLLEATLDTEAARL
jgi:hypothetical protein